MELFIVSLVKSVSMCTSEKQGVHCRNGYLSIKEPSNVKTRIMEYLFMIDWESASVRAFTPRYWERRVVEAVMILQERATMNLDCSLMLSDIWEPALQTFHPYLSDRQ
jgi:hypothetical protein